MSDSKKFLIDALKSKFVDIAAINPADLSWDEGKLQIDMMVEIANCINNLEKGGHRHGHHHHHHPKPGAPVFPKEEAAGEEEEFVIVEIDEGLF